MRKLAWVYIILPSFNTSGVDTGFRKWGGGGLGN